MIMKKYKTNKRYAIPKTTKHFGDIELVVDVDDELGGTAEFKTTFNRQKIRCSLWDCKNAQHFEAVLPFFWETIGIYAELNKKAKKAIVKYFDFMEDGSINEDGYVKYFFDEIFRFMGADDRIATFGVKTFGELELNIERVVANMPYPDVTVYCGNVLEVCLSYIVSDLEQYRDKRLCVTMDKELHVTKFTAILD